MPGQARAALMAIAVAALVAGCDQGQGLPVAEDASLGNPEVGRLAVNQYACISCHIVPGVVGPDARVGPTLVGIAERKFIAGVLPNTPENMVLWLLDPQAVDPLTAMPDMGLSEQHARDIAAYLYAQR